MSPALRGFVVVLARMVARIARDLGMPDTAAEVETAYVELAEEQGWE